MFASRRPIHGRKAVAPLKHRYSIQDTRIAYAIHGRKAVGEGPCRVRTIGMGGVKSPRGAGEAEKS